MSEERSDGSVVPEEGNDGSDVSEEGNDGSVMSEEANEEVIQRTLRPKTLAFDIKSRFHFENYEEVIVTQPFDPNNIPEPVEDNFIEVDMQMRANLERLPLFLETYHKNIFSTSIVGWMQMPNREMILATTKHWTQEERYIPPLTDILFPVLVTKNEELPIPRLNYMLENCKVYNPGMYLALMLDVREPSYLAKITLEINPPNNPTFNVITFRAVLEKYVIYIENGITLADPQSKFNQIVDKLNEEYGVFGLYAGGPLPPPDDRTGVPRVCWDLTRTEQSMSGIFRFDSFEKSSRRYGIICSRDALLEVKEKASEKGKRFNSLLKESSFVIIDGNMSYAPNNGKITWDYIKINEPLILLVAPEGFSCLNVTIYESDTMCRFACYCLENNAKMPLSIKWTHFQQDFNVLIAAVVDIPVFNEIMRKEDLRNYLGPFSFLNTNLIFCLARVINRSHHREYRDIIHLYAKLPHHGTTVEPNNYFYLSTIVNIFDVFKENRRLILSYKQTIVYNRDRLYPFEGIEGRLSPHLNENEINTAVDLLHQFDQMARNVYQHFPLKELFQRFTNTPKLMNQTQIGIDRCALLEDFAKPHHFK